MNKFSEVTQRLNDLLEVFKNNTKEGGEFMDSRFFAKLVNKNHKNVVRDIEITIENVEKQLQANLGSTPVLSSDSLLGGPFRSEPGNENISDVRSHSVVGGYRSEPGNENISDVRSHFGTSYYMDQNFQRRTIYHLDEVAYLTMLSRYDDVTTYCLAYFYVEAKKLERYPLRQLAKLPYEYVIEALELIESKHVHENEIRMMEYQIEEGHRTAQDYEKIDYSDGIFYDGWSTQVINLQDKWCKNEINRFIEFMTKKRSPFKPLKSTYATSMHVKHICDVLGMPKEHKIVRRDINNIISNINNSGTGITVDNEDFADVGRYRNSQNKLLPMYYLSEVGFLTLMGHYFDAISYKLSELFVSKIYAYFPEVTALDWIPDNIIKDLLDILKPERGNKENLLNDYITRLEI